MKQFLFFLVILFLLNPVSSQTVAQDWTHTDCISNNQYNLFSLLDSHKVVVMEFEMGCSTCNIAANFLDSIKQIYDVSHPAKVKFFAMDYWPGHTCTNIQTFVNSNGLSFGGFAGCAADKNYYASSSPMPMIVITGGAGHQVYYKKLFYDSTQSVPIVNAIDQALADIASAIATASNIPFSVSVSAFPSQQDVFLIISSDGNVMLEAEVFNLTGQKILQQEIVVSEKGYHKVKLNLSSTADGVYFLRYKRGLDIRTVKFVIQQ
jgi:hypothetical protein